MNTTTDLIYPALINLSRTFKSQEYRLEIEKLTLGELDQYIDELSKTSSMNDINRNEKLRLCLRFRNAFLINLPYFEVTEIYERMYILIEKYTSISIQKYTNLID